MQKIKDKKYFLKHVTNINEFYKGYNTVKNNNTLSWSILRYKKARLTFGDYVV